MNGIPIAGSPNADWSITYFSGTPSIQHIVECYNEVTLERIICYNDATGTGGAGYVWAKVYSILEVEVPGSPFQVSNTVKSDNASFGIEFLPDSPQCIQIVFPVSGVPKRFQSSDYCRSWKAL